MMKTLTTLLIGATLAGSGIATAAAPDVQARGEARLAKLLDGRVAGKPVDCIDLHSNDSTEIIDHTAIVYHDGSRLYVNRPTSGLETLDDDDILLTKTYSSELCSIDIVRLIDRASRFEHGFVSLGKFVPYTRPPAAK